MEQYVKEQRAYFHSGATRPYAFRKEQLLRLRRMLKENEEALLDALKKDLHKSPFEAYATEIGILLHSINHTLKHLKRWMKGRRVKRPLFLRFAKAGVEYEPKGTVLIIGPYNYPLQLLVEPLIGALAAGNTAIVKPSEFPAHTEKLLARLVNETFDPRLVHAVTGGVETTQELLNMPFDHIFFTGSTRVGRIVYQAAAENLVPVTLELGGKSPCIIDESAKLAVAARRIVFGKLLNAGQTCIAPDYLLVDKKVKGDLIRHLKATLEAFYPDPEKSLGRIINDKHFERIVSLIDEDKVVYGGEYDKKSRYIAPTILDGITFEDAVMQEEIFGPLLPIIAYEDLEETIETLKEKPAPLALYVFTEDKTVARKVVANVPFGNGAVNDTIYQVANPHLPFGGRGQSGIGHYHGKASFEAFSHRKSLVERSTKFDPAIAYPPHTKRKMTWIRRLMG